MKEYSLMDWATGPMRPFLNGLSIKEEFLEPVH